MKVVTQEWSIEAQSSHGRTPGMSAGMAEDTPPAAANAAHQRATTETLSANASAANAASAAKRASSAPALARGWFMARIVAEIAPRRKRPSRLALARGREVC